VLEEQSSIPILLAVDLDRRKARWQGPTSHDVLGADRDFLAVEISKMTGPHIDRTNAQPHVLDVVDPIEIDQSLQRSLERRSLVVADAFIR
jgi:hypothetical protein